MKEIKTISVKCDTKDTLNIAEMTELQGKLKARNSEKDIHFTQSRMG